MITQFRVGLRLQRFELVAAAIAVTVLAISALMVRVRLDATGVSAQCWATWMNAGPIDAGACTDPVQAFLGIRESEGGKVMAAMTLLPIAVGAFLGVGIVSREIEGGTASTVWALAGSRARWLIGRILPPLVVVVLLLACLTVCAEVLWSGRQPWQPSPSFDDAGYHGPVIVAKGLAAFGLALLAGATVGRALPAMIVASVLAVGLYLGGGMALGAWLQGEAAHHVVEIDPAQGSNDTDLFPGGTFFSQRWLTPDGRLLGDDDALALAPAGQDPWAWAYANLTTVMTGVPGSMYPTWSVIETTGFTGVALGGLLASFAIVSRRRPL